MNLNKEERPKHWREVHDAMMADPAFAYEWHKLQLGEALIATSNAGGNDHALSKAYEDAEKALDAFVGSLRTRIIQLERDARRLDWLEEEAVGDEVRIDTTASGGAFIVDAPKATECGSYARSEFYAPTLRDAIDAAMSEWAIGGGAE
jgi:hypothetical protein